MSNEIDYSQFHNLESYLFGVVGPQFQRSGQISPADFYVILVWKANRSKNKGRDRLKGLAGTFENAVVIIAADLWRAVSQKERLQLLMVNWGFRLPMASAILAVLYSDDFTVYDVRVCEELRDFSKLGDRVFSDRLWSEYERFRDAVNAAVPQKASLRERDHFLWGKSFHRGILRDCAA